MSIIDEHYIFRHTFEPYVIMGNWQLEVAKMAIYIFVPVGAFYAFHQVKPNVATIYTHFITILKADRLLK